MKNEKKYTKLINIYTDGSCVSKFGVGGYCAVIFLENQEFKNVKCQMQRNLKKSRKTLDCTPINTAKERLGIKGKRENTTNNEMELTAFVLAMQYLNSKGYLQNNFYEIRVKIYTS